MARRKSNDELFDPRSGGQAIRLSDLRVSDTVFDPARTNYFTIYLIEGGSGTLWADASRFAFSPSSLLFFVPYQHIRFIPDAPVQGEVIQFHANFLCVETFHTEVGCSGILFNDPYGIPVVQLDEEKNSKFQNLISELRREQTEQGLAFSEAMLAHLKVLLSHLPEVSKILGC